HAGVFHLFKSIIGTGFGNTDGQVGDDFDLVSGIGGIQGGGPYTVIGCDAYHGDVFDVVVACPAVQGGRAVVGCGGCRCCGTIGDCTTRVMMLQLWYASYSARTRHSLYVSTIPVNTSHKL